MSAIPLLLLPGLLFDARLYAPQVSALADVARVTAADLTGADSITALAEAALAQAPPGPFALGGLSMGGYVALEIVRRAPERVLALALLDTNARADSAEATANRHEQLQRAETDFEAVVAALMPRLLHPDHVDVAAQGGVVRAMMRDLGPDVFARQQRAIIGRADSRADLPGIACPTLVLCGADDVLTPPPLHEEIANAVPGARLVVVPHCGHVSPLEQPRAVNDALRAWLASASRR